MVLPEQNKVRVAEVNLQLIVKDFLNSNAKGAASYTLPHSDRVLRQAAWPEDATLLWAQLDENDDVRAVALQGVRDLLRALSGPMPPLERDEDGMPRLREDYAAHLATALATIDTALATPPARNLLVGIESASFALVQHGAEPSIDFDYLAFLPAAQGKAK